MTRYPIIVFTGGIVLLGLSLVGRYQETTAGSGQALTYVVGLAGLVAVITSLPTMISWLMERQLLPRAAWISWTICLVILVFYVFGSVLMN